MGGVKPAGVMKTLSGTFAFVVLAVIAIVTVLSCQTQLSSANRRKEKRIGDPDAIPPIYVEFKNGQEDPFRAALTTLKQRGGDCQIFLLRKSGDPVIFNYCDSIPSRLKTNKIIKSAAANNARPEESIANDPNVTYRVASANQADIDAVLQTLK